MCKQETKYYNHTKQISYTSVYFNLRIFYEENALPWLRQLVSGLSLQRQGFSPKATHVGCGGHSNTRTGFFQVLQFSCWVHSSKHPYSHSTSHLPSALYNHSNKQHNSKTINEWNKVFKL